MSTNPIPHIVRRKFIGIIPKSPFWNGTAAKTLLFDAMSLLTPLFEHFIVASVILNRHGISDPSLKQHLSLFLAQETEHRLSYEQLLSQWKVQGLAVERIQKHQAQVIRLLSFVFGKKWLLSFSVATEHWTALLSHTVLTYPKDYLEYLEQDQSILWLWHAIEEIEHKAVAFDIQKALEIGYFQRVCALLITTCLFMYFYWKNIVHLIFFHRLPFWKTLKQVFWLWNAPKRGLLTRGFLELCAFFKPHFHPWHNNNHHLIAHWQKKLKQSPYQEHFH